ncbi:MAG: CPBP family intramembrane glutamic endopeptidase [Gemmatimonadaceae bacterium]
MITGAQFPPVTPLTVDVQSAVYVLVVLVAVPIGAVRSKAVIEKKVERRPLRRSDILVRALLVQLLLFAISFFVARSQRMALWSWSGLRAPTIAIALAALAVVLGVGAISWQLRTPDERRSLWMRTLLPRTSLQWALWLALSLAAGVAEETAYRGVLVVLLASVTASFVAAVLLSAAAFAIAHYPQGAKSMGWVFALGLVMQAVVSATGTLYVAMGVHAVYDVTAALRAKNEYQEDTSD